MKKYYAIKNGYNFLEKKAVKNEIVRDWGTCSSMVKGVKNAQYKSFKTLEEANVYLGIGVKEENHEEYNGLRAYVDGSFNIENDRFSFGVVIIKDNIVVHADSGMAEDDSKKNLRQIAGELLGAEKALEYACLSKEKKIKIYHDYVGVRNHVTGEWKRNGESSQQYFAKMNGLVESHEIDLTFEKVDSHTGDLFNEIADELAKKAGGVRMNYDSDKIIKNTKVIVADEDLKRKLEKIVREDTRDNIIVK